MPGVVVSRVKFYEKSGARIYIPESILEDSRFPFKNNEVVKIQIGNDSLSLERVEWWEMLDWGSMPDAFEKLPPDVQAKIREAGLL